MIPQGEIDGWQPDAIRALYWKGIVTLPWVWPEHKIERYADYMKRCPVYSGHVKAQGDGITRWWKEAKSFEVLSYDMRDAIAAPHFLEWAMQFTPLVAALFGEPPLMYSCNAFWTRPGTAPSDINIQEWHRDRDDQKFVALFLYGTPVEDERDGPHLYNIGSHRKPDDGNRPPHAGEAVQKIMGPAGTAFLTMAGGLHMGMKPTRGERLLAWARWGVSNPPRSYAWDALAPVPGSSIPCEMPDEETRESTQLVVDWGK